MEYKVARPNQNGKIHKTRAELIDAVDKKLRELKLHGGPDAFDPVVLLSIIACESFDKGELPLAVQAAKEVAKYLRPQLQSVKMEADVTHHETDTTEAKERLARMAGIDADDNGPAKLH